MERKFTRFVKKWFVKTGFAKAYSEIPWPGKRVSMREMSVFCRQFAALAGAGLPILLALSLLEEQTGNKSLRDAVREIAKSVESGTSLTGSMRKKPKIFSPLFISLVKAGEESGQLSSVMERIAVHYEKTARLKNTVQKAMIYPVILLCACLALILLLLAFLLPVYTELFAEISVELPTITRDVLYLAEALRNRWKMILCGVVLLCISFRFAAQTERGGILLDRAVLLIPCFGTLHRMKICASFAGTLGLLTGAGIMLPEALELTAAVMEGPLWRREVQEMKLEILQGISLAEAVKRSGLFPPVLCHMVGIGEETGSLPKMFAGAAGYYEEEASARAEAASAALEPVTILVMAGMVAVVIAAVFAPTIALYESIEYF